MGGMMGPGGMGMMGYMPGTDMYNPGVFGGAGMPNGAVPRPCRVSLKCPGLLATWAAAPSDSTA